MLGPRVCVVSLCGGLMNKKEWKDAIKSVRMEKNWKKPSKNDLIEAAQRYLHKGESVKRLRELTRGVK